MHFGLDIATNCFKHGRAGQARLGPLPMTV